MSKQDYDGQHEQFMNLAQERVKEPFIPVSAGIQMAEDLYVWAKADSEILATAGLNLALIDELRTRAGAVRYIQSQWISDKNTRSKLTKKWKVEAPEGFKLQSELLHYFRFAFHGHPDLLNRVEEIAQNSGNADMIQDLMDSATLGKDNLPLLESAGLEAKKLDRAEELAEKLSETLAYNNNDQNLSNELKEERDRAFIHLYDAIREVNRVGQFVFWRNPERKKGYVNTYK